MSTQIYMSYNLNFLFYNIDFYQNLLCASVYDYNGDSGIFSFASSHFSICCSWNLWFFSLSLLLKQRWVISFWEHFGFYYINTSTFLYDFLNFIIFPDHCVKLFLKGYTQKVCKAVKSVFFEDYRLNIVGFVTHCPFTFTTKVVFFGFHWLLWQIHSFHWFTFKRGGRGWRGVKRSQHPPCYSFTHLTDTA